MQRSKSWKRSKEFSMARRIERPALLTRMSTPPYSPLDLAHEVVAFGGSEMSAE
jgi:hypothetical protein